MIDAKSLTLDSIQKMHSVCCLALAMVPVSELMWNDVMSMVALMLYFSVKGKYEGQIRPKTGAPGIFPQELEADFALYLKQCDMLRIPKTKQEFKEDIWHYVNYHNLTFKQLQEDGPGLILTCYWDL